MTVLSNAFPHSRFPSAAALEWSNEPTPLTLNDYEEVKAGFVRKAIRCPGVKAIYEHRSSEYDLGISDIDFVVVCDQGLPRGTARALQLNLEDPHARAIYRGGPRVIPDWLFQETMLNPNWELRLLAGAPIERKAVSAQELGVAKLMAAADRSGVVLLSLTRRMLTSRWPVVTTLGILKGLMHNSCHVFGFDAWPLAMQRWWREVYALRREWFVRGPARYTQLASLTQEACEWATHVCWEMDHLSRQRHWLEGVLQRPACLLAPDRKVLMFANTPAEGRHVALQVAQRLSDWVPVVIPTLHYLQFATTIRWAQGAFQRALRRLTYPPALVDGELCFQGIYESVLKRRVAMQQEWFTFLHKRGLPGWGCEPAWWMQLQRSSAAESTWQRLRFQLGLMKDAWQRNRVAHVLTQQTCNLSYANC